MDEIDFTPFLEAAKARRVNLFVWQDQKGKLLSTTNFWMLKGTEWWVCTPKGNVFKLD